MSSSQPTGALSVHRIPPPIQRPTVRRLADALKYGTSSLLKGAVSPKARWQTRNAGVFGRSLAAQKAAEDAVAGGAMAALGHLWLAKVAADGDQIDLGLASCRVVTTAGVGYIVDAFQNLVEVENMRYHGVGTGSTAEASSQTTLVTELTTQYATSNTRPTGSLGEQSGNGNVFETTATITVSAAVALTEHGIFSQAATGGGVLLDRSVFAAVSLNSGESLQATYDFTLTAGS